MISGQIEGSLERRLRLRHAVCAEEGEAGAEERSGAQCRGDGGSLRRARARHGERGWERWGDLGEV